MVELLSSGRVPGYVLGCADGTEAKLPVLKVKSDADLLSCDFLMMAADAIEFIDESREGTTDWLVDTIYSWPGIILDGAGKPIEIYAEIFDDAYGNDPSFCWNTNVKRFAKRRPLRRPKAAMLLRLQLWDAALKIVGREIILPTY
jgi:hypothetical protein